MIKNIATRLLLVVAIICVNVCAHAQDAESPVVNIAPEVKDAFNSSIVTKVYEVLRKTKVAMSVERQVLLANLFQGDDDVLFEMIQQGSTPAEIDEVKIHQQSEFDAFLTPIEKFNYYTAPKFGAKPSPIPYSQLSLAIKLSDSLELTEDQVTELLKKIEELRKMKDEHHKANVKKAFDSRAFESKALSEILTTDQHTQLMYRKNGSKAVGFAEKDWQELVDRGLSQEFEQQKTLTALSTYYLSRLSTYDQFAHDKLKLHNNLVYLDKNKPKALIVLYNARRHLANETIGTDFQW